MSSCPLIRSASRQARFLALLVLVVAVAVGGASGAAAEPSLVTVPGGTMDGQVRLIVQMPDSATAALPSEAFSASVDGVSQPTDTRPVLSDRLAMALVVDASADGAQTLPAALSGAANFVLAAPPSARGALVTDGTPPAVAVPWPAEPAATLNGLSAVRSGGARSPAAALDLALAQLPADATGPRLVLLCTGAPDAGGEPAAALVERLRSAGVLLAVVETAPRPQPGADYWADVAAGTGGPAVRAAPTDVIGAFDKVASALQRRYLLTFPAPARLPATAVVRVETGGGPEVSTVTVPAATSGAGIGSGLLVTAGGVAAVVALALGLVALRRRRRSPDDGPTPPPGRAPPQAWNIPPRPAPFVAREALHAELTQALRGGGPVRVCADPTAAGLGTTTAMADFALRHRGRYDIAWWVTALDPDLIPERLAELAEALGVAGADDPAEHATSALLAALRDRPRWLLVIDDAGDPHELDRYLPSGGDVLIASPDACGRAEPVTVPPFTRAESVALLRSGRGDLPAGTADRIAAALGDVPLAIGPAAGLLADTDVDADALAAVPDGAATAGIWSLALDRLAGDSPEAMALLTLVAWLGSAPVPLSLVAEHPRSVPEPLAAAAGRPTGPAELADLAALLGRRGLAQVTAADLRLHQVPAELVMARTGADHGASGGWTAVAVRLLRAAAPELVATEPACLHAWRRLLPHVVTATDPARRLDPVADDVRWLLTQAGGYLAARGRSASARALLDDAQKLDPSPAPPEE